MFDTKGIDLLKVVEEAKENGNEKFAEEIERCIANVQACYDVIAQKCTATGNEELWRIDVEYLKGALK
jgi:hypothetical protein